MLFRNIIIAFSAVAGFFSGFLLPLRFTVYLRYNFAITFIIVFLVLWIVWKFPEPLNHIFSVFVTMVLFSGVLASLWRIGANGIYEVFGLLPWFDAQGYYSDALRLLDGDTFVKIAARRPFFSSFLATLLWITQRNLRLSLAIVAGLIGLTTWLFSRAIHNIEKSAILPAIISCGLFFFSRWFAGDVLTENLGLIFGLIGTSWLVLSATNQRLISALVGLFFFSLAMLARPGAVLSIPLLILWTGFSGSFKKTTWQRILLSTFVVFLAIIINGLMTSFITSGPKNSFANFAYSFYGMADGGKGWQEIIRDHPEINNLSDEGEKAKQIYLLSFDVLRNHPKNFILAILQSYKSFFSLGYSSAFSFLGSYSSSHSISMTDTPMEFATRLLALLLYSGSFVLAFIKRKSSRFSLMACLNLGVLLSLPFAPPSDAEYLRVYAVSIPGMILSVGMVLHFLLKKGRIQESHGIKNSYGLPSLSVLLLSLFILGPFFIRIIGQQPTIPAVACPENLNSVAARISPGSTVKIGENKEDPFAIPYQRFLKDLDQFPDATIGQKLKTLPENTVISQQNNTLDGNKYFWLIGPEEIMKPTIGHSVFCGKWSTDPRTAFIFFASKVISN